VELESDELHPVSTTYQWAANGALREADNEAAVRLAERGIAAAPWPDHPCTTGCWWILILAYLASGPDDAASSRHGTSPRSNPRS
jgi:hypothetical protein